MIGYTGAGGDEFFDPAHSFPVSDGNVPLFVRTVEAVAERCRVEPDAMAARAALAADAIARRYDRAARDDAVVALFRSLAEDPPRPRS